MSPTTSEALLPTARHVEGLGLTLGAYALARGNALQVEVTVLAQKANELPQGWLDSLPTAATDVAGTTAESAAANQSAAPSQDALPPPNWYPDPGDPTQLRYWDGAAWTEHVHRNE